MAKVQVPTLILAAADQPSTARALGQALPHGKVVLTHVSMHELAQRDIAVLITPFLV